MDMDEEEGASCNSCSADDERRDDDEEKMVDAGFDSTDEPIMDGQTEISDQVQLEKDKKAVYNHPLFPLLALLLEKCEIATATLSMSDKDASNASFSEEIQEFVQHHEKDGKPILSDDPEVDALMIKAIQVLRIHLLELEKVQELCKDFCLRYITCLRTKMNSENLLRGASGLHHFENSSCSGDSGGESDDCDSSDPNISAFPSSSTAKAQDKDHENLAPGKQRLYRKSSLAIDDNSNDMTLASGVRVDSGTEGDLDDEEGASSSMGKKAQKRGVLPKQATSIMRSWLFQHIVHPYPTEDEKRTIAGQTSLTLLQVNNWFINARRRILQPMLDSANNSLNNNGSGKDGCSSKSKDKDGGGGSKSISTATTKTTTKKQKITNKSNPSLQRFWPESIANAIQSASTTGSDNKSRRQSSSK